MSLATRDDVTFEPIGPIVENVKRFHWNREEEVLHLDCAGSAPRGVPETIGAVSDEYASSSQSYTALARVCGPVRFGKELIMPNSGLNYVTDCLETLQVREDGGFQGAFIAPTVDHYPNVVFEEAHITDDDGAVEATGRLKATFTVDDEA